MKPGQGAPRRASRRGAPGARGLPANAAWGAASRNGWSGGGGGLGAVSRGSGAARVARLGASPAKVVPSDAPRRRAWRPGALGREATGAWRSESFTVRARPTWVLRGSRLRALCRELDRTAIGTGYNACIHSRFSSFGPETTLWAEARRRSSAAVPSAFPSKPLGPHPGLARGLVAASRGACRGLGSQP